MRAENPQAGASGVPFMNRITGFAEIALRISSRRGFVLSSVMRFIFRSGGRHSALVWIDRAWMRSPTSLPNTS